MGEPYMNDAGYSTGVGGGGPMAADYNTGSMPQQQLNDSTQQMLAMAGSQLNSGQTLTPQVAQGVDNAYMSASQAQTNLNTPQGRQPYLDNTNLDAAQGNYDNLAKQLASFDVNHLQPQFAGQNPGMPTDLPNNPDVYMGNVSYVTPNSANMPASQGIYNANPGYALTAQNDQRNVIVDLLGTINSIIGKERARGTNKYTSDLKSLDSILGQLGGLMTQNTNLTMKKAELAQSNSAKSQDKYNTVVSLADKLVDDLATGKVQWGDAWSQVKTFADRNGVAMSPTEIDTLLHGKYDWQNPDKSTGWAQAGAAQDYAQGLRYKQAGGSSDAKSQAMAKIGANVINSLDQVPSNVINSTGSPTALSAYTKVSRNIFGIPLAGTLTKNEQEQANLQSKYFALVQSALTAIQGSRPSDYDVKSYQQQLGPSIANPPQVNQDRINNLISLMGIQGQITFGNGGNTNSSGSTNNNDPLGIR